MKPQVNITTEIVDEINAILSRGKDVEIAVKNGRLVVWEKSCTSKKKIEVVVA